MKKVCAVEGARSLSDFARDAILQRVRSRGNSKASLSGDLSSLGEQLVQIDDAIKSLSARIGRVLGPNGHE